MLNSIWVVSTAKIEKISMIFNIDGLLLYKLFIKYVVKYYSLYKYQEGLYYCISWIFTFIF